MRLAHITDMVAIISKARVPIIKFVTNEGMFALLPKCIWLIVRQVERRCLAQPDERDLSRENRQSVLGRVAGRPTAGACGQGFLVTAIDE